MHTPSFRLRWLFAFAFTSVLSAAPIAFDIPTSNAPAAIDLFIKQSSTRVVYRHDDLKDVQTNAVRGAHEPAAALAILVSGTKLTVSERAKDEFAIGLQKPGSIDGAVRDESGRPVAGARVSLAGSDLAAVTDRRGRFVFAEVDPGVHSLQITADGLQNTRVTDVTVHAGRELSMSPITIPVRKPGTLELETYTVSAKKNEGTLELDPYAVTGQKPNAFTTANIDVTRTEDDVLPFNVITAKEIEQSGAQDLAEFFRKRLPQNFQRTIPEEALSNGQLRDSRTAQNALNFAGGLAQNFRDRATELIILVDGRRLPIRYSGFASETSVTSGDFRGIPVASIERIEYLSSAASAIYGAGATKGVINIITKRDYRGGSISLGYETPLDTHAPNRSVDFYYAMPLRWGVSLRVSYAYSDRDPLRVGDRADVTIERGRRLISQRQPALFPQDLVLGATPNIISASGGGLFGPGSATFTSSPDGYAGGQGIAPFLSRQGVFNLNLAEGGISGYAGKGSRFGAVPHERDLGIGLDKTFGDNWRATVEYRRTKNAQRGSAEFEAAFDGSLSYFVPASAPTNPFGTDVFVYAYDPRLERPELYEESIGRSDQFTATLRGKIREWMAIFDASYIRDEDSYRKFDFQGPLGSGFSGFGSATASGIYNPFVDMRTTAPAPPSFYEEYLQFRMFNGGTTDNFQITAKTSGSLYALPAGDLQVTGGLEWLAQDRSDSYNIRQTGINSKTGVGGVTRIDNPTGARLKSFSTSAYAEVNVPLIGGKKRLPLVQRLDLFASGRISRQSLEGKQLVSSKSVSVTDANGATTLTFEQVHLPRTYDTTPHVYAAGLRYDAVEGLAFRISRSIGYRPPTLTDTIPGTPNTGNQPVIDRRTGLQVVLGPGTVLTGGNNDLRPETTNSTNYGIIFEPARIRGLRMSLDYVESIRDDAIVALSPQTVLDLEATDPVMAARVQRNTSGAITAVDARTMNFTQVATKTANLTLSQRIEEVFGGQVVFTASAAKNISYKIQSSATALPLEQVRVPTRGNVSKWNANAQVTWEGKQWSFGWDTQYSDSVLVTPTWYVAQGADRLDWVLDHGVFASYRSPRSASANWRRWLLSELSITLGVKNVFNRAPRFEARASAGGYYFGGDSVYGRSVWLNVKKTF